MSITVTAFDAATTVSEIRYRLAPIDVGFDLRELGTSASR